MAKKNPGANANDSAVSSSAQPKTERRKTSRQPASGHAGAVVSPEAIEPSEAQIRLRAYLRYLERGAGDGADFDDWLQAEMELKKEVTRIGKLVN